MTPSGPYKSWLMNAALRQARRAQAAAELRWRQIAGGLSFAAQATFYPLYAAVQSIRLVSRRFGDNSGAKDRILSPSAEADAAIEAVLSLAQQYAAESVWVPAQSIELDENLDVDLWSDRPADANLAINAPADVVGTAAPPRPKAADPIVRRASTAIQAIASQLSNRALVLIDTQNQAIVLTNDQQYALQRRITEANAIVAYRRRQASLRPAPTLLARWQTWMETGVVAQGFNLFGESQIQLDSARSAQPALMGDPRFLALNSSGDLILNPEWAANLETVDRTIHQLERQTRPGRLSELIQAAIDYFFGPSKSLSGPGSPQTAPAIGPDPWPLAQPPGTGIAPSPRNQPALSQGSGSQGSGSQGFGSQGFGPDQPELPPSPPPSRPNRTWIDLFRRDRPGALTPPNGDQSYLDWDPTADPIALRRSIPLDDDDWTDHHLGPTRAGLVGGGATPQKADKSWINPKTFGSQNRSIMGSKSQGSGLSQPHSSTPDASPPQPPDPSSLIPTPPSDPTRDPTLIDTAAKSLGYDRHPLERILNGLDRLLLACERGLLWLWRSLLHLIGLR